MYNTEYKLYQLDKTGYQGHQFGVMNVLHERPLVRSSLIIKFNAEMRKRGLSGIDTGLVEIRDALAHGRVSSATLNDNLRLLKFDRPVNGRVRVVFNEKMTDSWFATQIKRVYEAIQFVENSLKP